MVRIMKSQLSSVEHIVPSSRDQLVATFDFISRLSAKCIEIRSVVVPYCDRKEENVVLDPKNNKFLQRDLPSRARFWNKLLLRLISEYLAFGRNVASLNDIRMSDQHKLYKNFHVQVLSRITDESEDGAGGEYWKMVEVHLEHATYLWKSINVESVMEQVIVELDRHEALIYECVREFSLLCNAASTFTVDADSMLTEEKTILLWYRNFGPFCVGSSMTKFAEAYRNWYVEEMGIDLPSANAVERLLRNALDSDFGEAGALEIEDYDRFLNRFGPLQGSYDRLKVLSNSLGEPVDWYIKDLNQDQVNKLLQKHASSDEKDASTLQKRYPYRFVVHVPEVVYHQPFVISYQPEIETETHHLSVQYLIEKDRYQCQWEDRMLSGATIVELLGELVKQWGIPVLLQQE